MWILPPAFSKLRSDRYSWDTSYRVSEHHDPCRSLKRHTASLSIMTRADHRNVIPRLWASWPVRITETSYRVSEHHDPYGSLKRHTASLSIMTRTDHWNVIPRLWASWPVTRADHWSHNSRPPKSFTLIVMMSVSCLWYPVWYILQRHNDGVMYGERNLFFLPTLAVAIYSYLIAHCFLSSFEVSFLGYVGL